jgi:hypothetical protein
VQAQLLPIEDKVKKKGDMGLASLSDFRCGAGSTVDARMILNRPQITLYCLDDQSRQAVFVELPGDVELSQRPFLFLTQYEHAQRLLTVSYETLHELAGAIGEGFRRLILMYSVGRAGGTLLSRSLNRLDTVLSLDEPDVYNNIVMIRPADGRRDAELTRLLHSSTRLLFKPAQAGVDTLFIKFRSCSIEIGDLMHKAFPQARVMFLYRNAETWARSAGRSVQSRVESHERDDMADPDPMMDLFRDLDLSHAAQPAEPLSARKPDAPNGRPLGSAKSSPVFPLLPAYIKRIVKSRMTGRDRLTVVWLVIAQRLPVLRHRFCTPIEYLQPYIRAIPPMKLLTLLWLSPVHRYLAMNAQGIPMLAVQYETLISAPEAALRAIFDYCGLPVDQASYAAGAFAEDSQKDTPLSRDRVRAAKSDLAPELLAQVREVLREHPPTQTPDFVLPGSLNLRQAEQNVGKP